MIVFFGTSPRSAKFLEKAIQNGLKVDLVVSEPPKPIGKRQILTENPTVTTAKKLNIPYLSSIFNLLQPSSIFNHQSSNIGLILDFNKIIPDEIINLFPKGIINVHFSKLPQYRGPAPVQYTILNGDKTAWISYCLISEKLDAGKIITQTSLSLDLTENTETLYQKLIEKSADEIRDIIQDYLEGKLIPQTQDGTPSITYKLTTENCKIDWNKPPDEIDRIIRASYPEPTAWTMVILSSRANPVGVQFIEPATHDKGAMNCAPTARNRVKILKAHMENEKLVFDIVQLEGKTPVSWKQFMQGYPNSKITRQF